MIGGIGKAYVKEAKTFFGFIPRRSMIDRRVSDPHPPMFGVAGVDFTVKVDLLHLCRFSLHVDRPCARFGCSYLACACSSLVDLKTELYVLVIFSPTIMFCLPFSSHSLTVPFPYHARVILQIEDAQRAIEEAAARATQVRAKWVDCVLSIRNTLPLKPSKYRCWRDKRVTGQ